jgi:dihydrolipoamide dehydrogenase
VPTSDAEGRTSFDLVVVGGGPGGYATALYAASAGLAVALVERDKVGGTCLHRGCVPAKELLETASIARTVAGAKEFGIDAGQPAVDFAVSQDRKQKVVDQLHRGLTGLLRARGVEIVQGTGRLERGRRIVVERDGERRELSGRHVVLASGSAPRDLPGLAFDGEVVIGSDEVLTLRSLPRSTVVVGGGAVGCEFASMFADLGVEVTIVEMLPSLLPGCDEEVAAVLARGLRRRGVTVRTGTTVQGHERFASGVRVVLGDGSSVEADCVVVAVGRRPVTEGLVGEGTGVMVDDRGFVVVDEWMRTGVEGVWAVGDVAGGPQLAHVGFAEGIVAVKGMLAEPVVPVDYGRVPWCIYSQPEVAFCGITERQAREAGIDVAVIAEPLAGNSRARILGDTDGLVKVIAERDADGRAGRLLGVHMVGPWATELLSAGYLAVNWEATVEEVAGFIQPHPTLSEAFGEAVLALTGRRLHVA